MNTAVPQRPRALTPSSRAGAAHSSGARRRLEVHIRQERQDREEFKKSHIDAPRFAEALYHLETGEFAVGLLPKNR